MNNVYEVKKNVDKIKRGGYTFFLSPNIYKEVRYKLNKDEYKVYYPYKDSDKVILYTEDIPKVRLFMINSYHTLTHREILGSLFGLNISNEVFGDIIVDGDKYYFYVMDDIGDFIINNLFMIGNKKVKVIEVDLDVLKDYERKYEELSMIVSSLRMDTVISRIIGTSRDKVKDMIKDKMVMVNYEVLNNNSYLLREDDVFSIRKYGKYKFVGSVGMTKKDNYIIKYLKYL